MNNIRMSPFRFYWSKGKGSSLDIAPLTILDSGTLQSESSSWLAMTVVPWCKLVAAHGPR